MVGRLLSLLFLCDILSITHNNRHLLSRFITYFTGIEKEKGKVMKDEKEHNGTVDESSSEQQSHTKIQRDFLKHLESQ